ncbi:MAG: 2-oxoacid:acceptor oxidoreductase subunit alpha [Chloroflexi bacterium]|nr:2-oxoacid:acceptor oxidoreductase subunit alpha [Chloroflexota bacterium]
MSRDAVLTGRHFMNGDLACAEGAIAAGCRFFGGYPITPSTEIAERLARRLPEIGGHYVQMEDELASIMAVQGAAWGGAKAMTATSGPGFSLMQETVGWAVMTETPCVIVDVQRGGPSTGLPTLVAQADVMQAKWGSHGDYEPIAYAPASCQEMFDLTIQAFNTAERLRSPVFVMADEVVGHTTELVVIPPADDITVVDRRAPNGSTNGSYRPYQADADLVPPMPPVGQGYRFHITGLTHDERGYPMTDADSHQRLVTRLVDKVNRQADALCQLEESFLDDAEVVVIAYGSTARAAKRAVLAARDKGVPAGLLRLVTVWPFPGERVRQLNDQAHSFVVAELNLGQMVREVERFARRPVLRANHAGGLLMPPGHILAAIMEAWA